MPEVDMRIVAFVVLSAFGVVLWMTTRKSNVEGELRGTMETAMRAFQQNNFIEAEFHFERALKLLNAERKPDVSKVITCLASLAQCYERSGNHQKARESFGAVVSKWEQLLQSRDPQFIDIDYAAMNSDFGRGTNDIADFYVQKVIPMRSQTLPKGHSDLQNSYVIASRLLKKVGRNDEAAQMEAMANS